MQFSKYIKTLLKEKNININYILEVEGETGINFIPLENVVEFCEGLDTNNKNKIKKQLIKIDFCNGNILDFFKYIAKMIAI